MLTIRGVYDGKTIRPLPGEPLPEVDREVEVRIVFCEPVTRWILRLWSYSFVSAIRTLHCPILSAN
jgi:hypothetical protein